MGKFNDFFFDFSLNIQNNDDDGDDDVIRS